MNVNPTFFIILVELLAAETIALLLLMVFFIRRKYQYRHIVADIIAASENSEETHRKALEQIFKDVFKENDENASSKAQQLAKAETHFCRSLISTFVSRKHSILTHLDEMTEELLAPYRSLISETAQEKVQTENKLSKNVDSLKHTIESLKEEKQNITEKLAGTENELQSIMNEYVSAFQKEKQAQAEQEKAMESPGDVPHVPDAHEAETEESITIMDDDPIASDHEETVLPADDDAGEEGIEITDEETAADDTGSENEDDGLLKLEDIDEVPDDSNEMSVSDNMTDGIVVTEEFIEDEAAGPDIPAENEAPQASEITDEAAAPQADQKADSATQQAAAILEDVDISSAPLSEDIATVNAVKSKKSAVR